MIIIILSIAILVLAFAVGLKKHNALVASGEIAERSMEFMYKVQHYTLSDTPNETIIQAARNIITPNIKASITEYNSDFVAFSGNKWSARLEFVERREGKVIWTLTFTHFEKVRYNVVGALDMNRLTTALEKMFLSFDNNVSLQTYDHDYKIK